MARRTKLWKFLRFALLATLLAAAGFTLYLDFRVRNEFEGRRFALPARIFARPLELHVGLRIAAGGRGRRAEAARLPRRGAPEGESGWFLREENRLEIALRPFVFWDGAQPARSVTRRLRRRQGVGAAGLAPARTCRSRASSRCRSAASIPRGTRTACWCGSTDVPKHLVQALIAVEDRSFYTHHGFDPRGLARAARSVFSDRRAGRQHHHPAAGEELLPHARAHRRSARRPSW